MSAQNCRVGKRYHDYEIDKSGKRIVSRPAPSPITHQRANNKKHKYGLLNILSIIFNPFSWSRSFGSD